MDYFSLIRLIGVVNSTKFISLKRREKKKNKMIKNKEKFEIDIAIKIAIICYQNWKWVRGA